MALFNAMDIARTGVGFSQYWLDTLAHNLANVNTINGPDEEPFRARLVVARELGDHIAPSGSGVGVAATTEYAFEAPQVDSPGHPMADEDGRVTMPVVDVAAHLSDMILAQRTYQLNVSSIRTAEQSYRSALSIGQRR